MPHDQAAKCAVFLLLVYSLFVPSAQAQSIEDRIDEFVRAGMECADIPGMMVAVIRDGQDFISKGYGYKEVGTTTPVTEDTLFTINSCSKAYVGITAAIVIKQHPESFTWWLPVRRVHGDDFYMADAQRTQYMNIRDMTSHRVGLPSNDMFRVANFTDEEKLTRFRFLNFNDDFRDVFRYNNIMYGLTGHTLKVVDGRRWEDVVKEELFDRVGMLNTTFIWDEARWEEIATPHYRDLTTGDRRPVSKAVARAYYDGMFSASGGVTTSARDVLQWLKFQLSEGKAPDGSEILTTGEFRRTHYATTHLFIGPQYEKPGDPVTYKVGQYAAGWEENVYRGYLTSQHLGGLGGFGSYATIMRTANHAIHTSMNASPDYGFQENLHMYIMDLLLGYEPWLNASMTCDRILATRSQEMKTFQEDELLANPRCKKQVDDESHSSSKNRCMQSKPPKPGKPSTDIEAQEDIEVDKFVGLYGHHGLGNLSVFETSGSLFMRFGKEGWVWQLDEMEANITFQGIGLEPIWYDRRIVTFEFDDNENMATSLTASFDATIDPVFERNLDWGNPPPPPELCESSSEESKAEEEEK